MGCLRGGSCSSPFQGLPVAHTYHHWLIAQALPTATTGQEHSLFPGAGAGSLLGEAVLCTDIMLTEVYQAGGLFPCGTWGGGEGGDKGWTQGCPPQS